MPNYGLIQNLAQMQLPNPGTSLIKEAIGAMQGYQQAQANKDAAALKQAEIAYKGTQSKIAEEELRQAPELMKMKQAMNAATISQMNANTAAARSGIGTENLRQQELQQKMQLAQYDDMNKLTRGIKLAAPDKKGAAYDAGLKIAAKRGYDISQFPKTWSPEAESMVDALYTSSDDYLKNASSSALEKVVGADGKPMLVPRAQAAGMQPYDAQSQKLAPETIYNRAKTESYVKQQELYAKEARAAEDTINNARGFMSVVSKIPTGTGPGIGTLAWMSPEGQEALKYAGKLSFAEVKTLGSGVSTDADLAAARKNTLSVGNSLKANKRIAEYIIALGQRKEERVAFSESLAQQGIYDDTLQQKLWTKYIRENPIIDAKTGNVNQDNVSNWGSYVTPEAIKTGKQPRSVGSTRVSSIPADGVVIGKDGKKYQKVSGGYEQVQ